MSFAYVNGGTVHKESSRPTDLVRIADGAKVLWSAYITDAELEACGWFRVVDAERPEDTAAHTHVRTLVVNNGVRVVWAQRARTAEELTSQARSANTSTMTDLDVVLAKITELKAFLTDPDVVAAEAQPNNTALTAAQQNRFNKAVARQLRRDANFDIRLARLVIGQYQPVLLDDISDT